MSERYLISIADDLGLDSKGVDPGIYKGIEHGAITGADVMLHKPNAKNAIHTMMTAYPHASLGLHIETLPNTPMQYATPTIYELRGNKKNNELRKLVFDETEAQIKMFQDITGNNPEHISYHDWANMDYNFEIMQGLIPFMQALFGDQNSTMIRSKNLIRHTTLTSLKKGFPPSSPQEFYEELKNKSGLVELAVHPGLNTGDVQGSPFLPEHRWLDLIGLINIVESGVIGDAGFQLISPKKYLELNNGL